MEVGEASASGFSNSFQISAGCNCSVTSDETEEGSHAVFMLYSLILVASPKKAASTQHRSKLVGVWSPVNH